MALSPSPSNRPQSYCGACTPSPRNERPAKASSAPPALIVAFTTSGSPMLGRTCRSRRRTRTTPPMRAAADTGEAGGGDELPAGYVGDERLTETREAGRAREADRQHRALHPHAED